MLLSQAHPELYKKKNSKHVGTNRLTSSKRTAGWIVSGVNVTLKRLLFSQEEPKELFWRKKGGGK